MKKIVKSLAIVMVLCIAICALAGCGDNKNKIVGSWLNNDEDYGGFEFVYTFNEDGTGFYDVAGNIQEFTYKTEADKLSIQFLDGESLPWDTEYKIEDDVLKVKDDMDEFISYKKIEKREAPVTNIPKEEQIGTAGSNMPLKDRYDDAKYEVEVAFQKWLVDTYGEKVFDARIYVEKIYSAEDEEEIEALKEMNLGPDEIAFDVRYELKPAQGVDVNELMAANGEYDEESEWIKNKFNCGILRPNVNGEEDYVVTNIGTGW